MNEILISDYKKQVTEIITGVKNKFGNLSHKQLNWKPAPDKWSIGQCLQHIIQLNNAYYPVVENKIQEAEKNKLFAKKTFHPNLLGKLVISSLKPGGKKTFKTYEVFKPVGNDVSLSVVRDLEINNEKLVLFMNRSVPFDLNKIKIKSPANRLFRFQLGALFLMIIVHEQRHILQAENVMKNINFPQK